MGRKACFIVKICIFLCVIIIFFSLFSIIRLLKPSHYYTLDMGISQMDDESLENEIFAFVKNNRKALEKISEKIQLSENYICYTCRGHHSENGERIYSITITQVENGNLTEENCKDPVFNALIEMNFINGRVVYNSDACTDVVLFETQLSNGEERMCFAYAPTEQGVLYLQNTLYNTEIDVKHIIGYWYFYRG